MSERDDDPLEALVAEIFGASPVRTPAAGEPRDPQVEGEPVPPGNSYSYYR